MMKKEIKKQTEAELKASLSQLRRNQFKMRLVKVSGEEVVQTHKIREIRRNIARIETKLTQIKEGSNDE
jgi:large subunit ribosomal protein L29